MAVGTRKTPLTQKPERVYRKRLEAGLQQGQLADRLSITRQHMNRIERGHAAASPALLVQLADVLGCKVADLLPDETPATAA